MASPTFNARRSERARLTAANTLPSSTTCSGSWLVAVRMAWFAVLVAALVPAIASFVRLTSNGSLEILFQGGVFSVAPEIADSLADIGIAHDLLLRADLVFRSFSFALFALTGIIIFIRKSDDWMTALASVVLVAGGTTWFAPLSVLGEDSLLRSLAAVVAGDGRPFAPEIVGTITGLSLVLFLLLFPDGRFVPHWARYVAVAGAVYTVLMQIAPGSFIDAATWPTWAGTSLLVGVAGGGVAAQLYRFLDMSGPIHKQQTKLVVSALTTIVTIPVFLFVLNPGLGSGFTELTLVTPRIEAVYNLSLLAVLGIAMLALPLSIAVSVLHYRLWDVDVLINQTLVYGALTGLLGATYFAVVAGVGAIIGRSTFDWANFKYAISIIVAVATLAVAAVFQPLRRSIQGLIDRYFYRERYDAIQKMEEFTQRLRQEIDLETLSAALLSILEQTVRPTGVSLWVPRNVEGTMRPDAEVMRRIEFWVAGGLEMVQGRDFNEMKLDDEGMKRLKQATGPIDLFAEELESDSLRALRDVRVKIAVPLLSQGEVVGMLNLGPRLSDIDYSSQDRRLLDNLADHAAAAVRVALLVREHDSEVKARERIENEMRVAQLIQQQLIPKSLPEVEGWEVIAHYSPAREVGGDFYDFIGLPDGRLCIVTGDVTGKGVPAALVMATTRSLLRGEATRLLSPSAILQQANEQLIDDIPEHMFVTCLCAVLDPRTGKMTIANAGHNLPFVRNDEVTRELRATGMPLGLMRGMTYQEYETILIAGDGLLLHSDGLVEAHGPDGEMFGFPRMRELVAACDTTSTIVDRLLMELDGFTGEGWEQEDDITLVLLRRTAEPPRVMDPAPGPPVTAEEPV